MKLYKTLFFQNNQIRFINRDIVIRDFYNLFENNIKTYIPFNETVTVSLSNVHNAKDLLLPDCWVDTTTQNGMLSVFQYMEENNYKIQLFKNWYLNYALMTLEDYYADYIKHLSITALYSLLEKRVNHLEKELNCKTNNNTSNKYKQYYQPQKLDRNISDEVINKNRVEYLYNKESRIVGEELLNSFISKE